MKVYYSGTKILDVWCLWLKREDVPVIGASVLELDEEHNRQLAALLLANNRRVVNLPDRFTVNGSGQLLDENGQIVTNNPNPEKEAWKLSQIHGMTQTQLETYIDNQMASITNISQAKAVIGPLLKKMAALELWLVKQSGLE